MRSGYGHSADLLRKALCLAFCAFFERGSEEECWKLIPAAYSSTSAPHSASRHASRDKAQEPNKPQEPDKPQGEAIKKSEEVRKQKLAQFIEENKVKNSKDVLKFAKGIAHVKMPAPQTLKAIWAKEPENPEMTQSAEALGNPDIARYADYTARAFVLYQLINPKPKEESATETGQQLKKKLPKKKQQQAPRMLLELYKARFQTLIFGHEVDRISMLDNLPTIQGIGSKDIAFQLVARCWKIEKDEVQK